MEFDFDVSQFSFETFESCEATRVDSLSTSCESASDIEVPVRHRKKKTRGLGSKVTQQFRLPSPQGVKLDIRRNYATLFARVHNSCDYDTMMSHIYNFYDTGVTVQQRDLRFVAASGLNTLNMSGPEYRGHTVLSEYWYRSMFIAPDQISKLRHACLTMRSDDTAKLKFCFSKIGTKVISALSDSEYQQMNGFLKDKSSEKKEVSFAAASMSDAHQKKRPYSDLIPSWVYSEVSPNDTFEDVDEETGGAGNCAVSESAWIPQSNVAPIVYEELTDFESVQAVQNYLIATRAVELKRAQQQQSQQQRPPHSTVKRSEKKEKAKRPPPRDWMSLACDAVHSGIIECRIQNETDEEQFMPRIAPTMDRCKLGSQPLPCPNEDVQFVPSAADKNVIVANFDCTISVELEFNADCKVVSMVVDLIT